MKRNRWIGSLVVLVLLLGMQCAADYNAAGTPERLSGRKSLAEQGIYIYEEIVRAHEAGSQELVTRLLWKQFGLNPDLLLEPDERTGYLVACYFGSRRFAEAAELVLRREGHSRRDPELLRTDLAACLRNYAIVHGVDAAVRYVDTLRQEFPASELHSIYWTVLPLRFVRYSTEGTNGGGPELWLDNPSFIDPYPASRADLERLFDRYPVEAYREYAGLLLRDSRYLNEEERWGAIPYSYRYLRVRSILDTLQVHFAPWAQAIFHGYQWPEVVEDSLRVALSAFEREAVRYLELYPDRPGFLPVSRYLVRAQLLLGDEEPAFTTLEKVAAAEQLKEFHYWRRSMRRLAQVAKPESIERIYLLYSKLDSSAAANYLLEQLNTPAALSTAARLLIETQEPRLQRPAYEALLNAARDSADQSRVLALFAAYHEFLPGAAGAYLYRMTSEPRYRELGRAIAARTEDDRLQLELNELMVTIAYTDRDAEAVSRYTGSILAAGIALPPRLVEMRRWAELRRSVRDLASLADFESAARQAKNDLRDRELTLWIINTGLSRLSEKEDLSYLLYLKILLYRDSRYYRQQQRAVGLIDSLLRLYPESSLADDALAERVYLQAVALKQFYSLSDAEATLAELLRRYPDYPERNALDNAYNWLAMGYRQQCRESSGRLARNACARSRELYEEMLRRFRFTRFYNYALENLRELDRLEGSDPLTS